MQRCIQRRDLVSRAAGFMRAAVRAARRPPVRPTEKVRT
jgi:hypothetical protein